MKTYLIGGAVRDLLLGIKSKDLDYVVTGSTPEELLNLGFTQVGADFPVFLHPETGDEYALARTELKDGVGYNGFKCEFSPNVTIEMDCFRRDITINAIALDQETDTLIDPFNGQEDLKNKIIRHVNPDSFADDPVRVLRVARFVARYDFEIAPETLELMKVCVEKEFDHLTPERVWKEIEKGLSEKWFYKMLQVLDSVKALDKLKPFQFDFNDIAFLQYANKLKASNEIKFALIAYKFKKNDYIKWKIPNNYSELSSFFNLSTLIEIRTNRLRSSNVEDLLDFIERSGSLKSEKCFTQVKHLLDIQNVELCELFAKAVNSLKAIDNIKVINGETNGLKIKQKIKEEKLRILSNL